MPRPSISRVLHIRLQLGSGRFSTWLWNKILIYCVYGVFIGLFCTFDVARKRIVSSNVTLFISKFLSHMCYCQGLVGGGILVAHQMSGGHYIGLFIGRSIYVTTHTRSFYYS